MTQVTSVSDEDVLRWSRNLLDRRKVPDLDNFIRLRGITLPDLNDSSRGDRRGRIIDKQEKIALLLEHKDSLAADGGGDAAAAAAAAAAGFAKDDIVSYRPTTTGSGWTLATVLNIGNVGASPIFQLRLADGTVKEAVTTGHMRARMQGRPDLVDADPVNQLVLGTIVQRATASNPNDPLGTVTTQLPRMRYSIRWSGTGVTEDIDHTDLTVFGAQRSAPGGQTPAVFSVNSSVLWWWVSVPPGQLPSPDPRI